MTKRAGMSMTAMETDAIWRQYNAVATCATIGRTLDKTVSTIYSIVSSHGGIAPRRRIRADDALIATERESISRGLASGQSIRAIDRALERAPSTVSREIERDGGPVCYRAIDADLNAWRRVKQPKSARLVERPQLRATVEAKLSLNGSPVQLSGWLGREYTDPMDMPASHDTIYLRLFVQTRSAANRALTSHRRTRRPMRRSKRACRAEGGRSRIVDAVSIAARQAFVEERAVESAPPHQKWGDYLTQYAKVREPNRLFAPRAAAPPPAAPARGAHHRARRRSPAAPPACDRTDRPPRPPRVRDPGPHTPPSAPPLPRRAS